MNPLRHLTTFGTVAADGCGVHRYGMIADPAGRPDIEAAFESLELDIAPDASPAEFLRLARGLMNRYGGSDSTRALSNMRVRAVDAGGVPAEYIARADAASDRRIVYLHGGAWIAGGLPAYRPLAATLARLARAEVLLVEYRLAPEHPYPAPLDDACAAIQWAAANGLNGTARAQVAVAGDSAGANLAAAACLRARSRGEIVPERAALLCGVLDLPDPSDSARRDPLCTAEATMGSLSLYAGANASFEDPLLIPNRADAASLAAFPPTLVQASGAEYLLGGSRRFASSLIDAGCRTTLSVWPNMPHSWHCFVDTLPEASQALSEVAVHLMT